MQKKIVALRAKYLSEPNGVKNKKHAEKGGAGVCYGNRFQNFWPKRTRIASCFDHKY